MPNGRPSLIFTLAVAILVLANCSRPPELVGIDNPAIPAKSVPQINQHRIFIISTRQASEVAGAFYSARRAPELGLASVDVTIPPTHVVTEVERPKRLPPDPRVEFAVVDPLVYEADASFISAVNRELASRPQGQRNLMLFIHGYNTTTSDAILRLAQFVEDTGYQGVPVLFTWASAARTLRYVYDLNSALVARVELKEATDILTRTNAEGADIFAHSMGTFLTMEGLVDAAQSGYLGRRLQLDHIVLASPDIDIDLFRTQITFLPEEVRKKIYLLVSEDDGALSISRRIAGGVPRVGAVNTEELGALGVIVIDLSEIDNSATLSHTKFVSSPEVVQLIGAGLNSTEQFGVGATPGLDKLLQGVPISVVRN